MKEQSDGDSTNAETARKAARLPAAKTLALRGLGRALTDDSIQTGGDLR